MKLEREIKIFLDGICIDYGFCLPPKTIEELISRESYDADSFIREIFIAEEMDPDLEIHLFREIKRAFTGRFGERIKRLYFNK